MVNYETIAREYARHRKANPEVLRSLVEKTGITSSSTVLEVGCGTGNYIAALERAIGCTCWGIDPSANMLATASGKSPTIRLQTGKAEQLEVADKSFDLIFSVDVIHHVSDQAAFFREAFRALRPGGRVWTVTDSEEIIRHRQPLAVFFPEMIEVELQRYPSVAEMRRLMEEAGFRNLAEAVVEFPFQVTDVAAYRDKAFSSLHFISADAHRRGVERMEQELKLGPIQGNSRYFMLWSAKAEDK
jgi:ubiquinone/menaquinone biosynthesis C-methylase UbiE